MSEKPIYMRRDEERWDNRVQAWRRLCAATASLGAAFAEVDNALKVYAAVADPTQEAKR